MAISRELITLWCKRGTPTSQSSEQDTNWFTVETTQLSGLIDKLSLLVPGPEWRRPHPPA